MSKPTTHAARRPIAGLALLGAASLWRIIAVSGLADRGVFVKYPALADAVLAGADISDRVGDVSQAYLAAMVVARGPLGLEHHQIVAVQVAAIALLATGLAAVGLIRWGLVAAAAAGLLTLGHRGALVNATELEPETLLMLLAGLGVAAVVGGESWRWGLAGGVLLGAAAATRPTVLLPGVLFLATCGWADHRRGLGWFHRSGAATAGVVIALLSARLLVAQLPGAATPMNPGTVFFEGWNADATGYQGEAPAVVKDVEYRLGVPDGLHPAYRLVARAATGNADPSATNSYWWRRAAAFLTTHPGASLRLAGVKAWAAIHAHESWDLATLERRSRLTRTWLLLPFSASFAVAGLGLALGRRDPTIFPLAAWLLGSLAVPILFYVTSRQRNLALPALVLLGAFAIHETHRQWRGGARRRTGSAVGIAVAAGLALSIPGSAQREDRHTWDLRFRQEHALAEASRLRGDPAAAESAAAQAVLALDRRTSAPEAAVLAAWSAEAASGPTAERRFDLAVVAVDRRWCRRAEALLAGLADEGYRPRRGARVTSSVAYHRARCAAAQGDFDRSLDLLLEARREQPGSPRILALEFLVADRAGHSTRARAVERQLGRLHDPATAGLAHAAALRTVGDHAGAASLQDAVWRCLARE